MTDGVTTVVSYYSFGGLRIAVKRGNTLFHLHGDPLGSTSLTTRGSSETSSRPHYAYGAERRATGDPKTVRTFTGQKRDATGLMFYKACYYDPALGTIVSPDSMVPGAGQVINYNRFLYARGNPLRYTDPTGNFGYDPFGAAWVEEFKRNHYGRGPSEQDRIDRFVSLAIPGIGPGGSWRKSDWNTYTRAKEVGEYIYEEMKRNQYSVEHIKVVVGVRSLYAEIYAEQPNQEAALGWATAGLAAYIVWMERIGPGRPWDHRPIIQQRMKWGDWHVYRHGDKDYVYRFDVWSNIHFGYIAGVIGFEEGEMLRGAGIDQAIEEVLSGKPRLDWLLSPSFGDDPYDQAAIRMGFELYKRARKSDAGLTSDLFWDLFNEYGKHLARCELPLSEDCPAMP